MFWKIRYLSDRTGHTLCATVFYDVPSEPTIGGRTNEGHGGTITHKRRYSRAFRPIGASDAEWTCHIANSRAQDTVLAQIHNAAATTYGR